MPGGGRAHGPDGRLYVQDMGKKARRVALASLLTSKCRKGQLSVIEPVSLAAPKTAEAAKIVETMGFADKKVLFVIAGPVAAFEKSVRNLPTVKTLACSVLNPHDLFSHDEVVLFQDSIAKIVQHLDPANFRRGKAEA
jgi:large subunit ribosomal protein L4